MSENRIEAFVRMEELFDISVKEILRPLKRQKPKSLDEVLEVGLRKGRSKLWLIQEDRLIEHILRLAIEMQLLTRRRRTRSTGANQINRTEKWILIAA